MTYLRHLLLLAVPFFLASTLLRIYVILLAPEYVQPSLLWGIAADLVWSLLPASLVLLLPRWRAGVMLILLLCWTLTHWLDVQSLLALGVSADYRDFHYVLDPVFLKSTLSGISPWLLLVVFLAVATLGWLCRWLLQRSGPLPGFTPTAVLVAGGLLLVLVLLPQAPVSDWHRRNSVAHQLQNLWLNVGGAQTVALQSSRHLLVSGAPATPSVLLPGRAKNVLLIVLEGLPGAYLPQVSAALSQPTPVELNHLSPWAARGLVVPQFVNHTRQTLRGLYAILCGDYPRLIGGTPKPARMLEYPASGDECLPRQLQNAGYQTAFFQAADLEFMSKGVFMPMIGFEQVTGQRSFEQSVAVTNTGYSWGPADAEFFQQVVPRLQQIDQRDSPWFVTLLTAGTHYPYGIDARPGATALDNKMQAVAAADEAAADFLQKLSEQALLEDTLVIVTSDEAHGIPGQALGANWGLFFVLAPDLEPAISDGLFGSVDIARSITDYLGLDFAWGESVFRQPPAARPLFFGHGTTIAMARDGLVHQCGKAGMLPGARLASNCGTLSPQGSALFSASYQQLPNRDHLASYATLVEGFLTIDAELLTATGFNIPLASPGRVPLRQGSSRFVGGGNYLDIPPHSQLSFELELGYRGPEPGVAQITLEGRDREDERDILPALVFPALVNGQRLNLNYAIAIGAGEKAAQFRLRVDRFGVSGELDIKRFVLSVRPLPGAVKPPEVSLGGAWSSLQYRLHRESMQLRPLYRLGNKVTALTHPDYFQPDWHNPEAGGIWSGASGTLQIPLALDEQNSLHLVARSRVELGAVDDENPVEVFANGRSLGRWQYSPGDNWGKRRLSIPSEVLALDRDYLQLEFRPQYTRSPGGNDSRQLGLFLQSLVLQQ